MAIRLVDPRVGSGWVRKFTRTYGLGREVAEESRRSGDVAAGQTVEAVELIDRLGSGRS